MAWWRSWKPILVTWSLVLLIPCTTVSEDLFQEVVLVVRERQLLAFSSSMGGWAFQDLMVQEWVQGTRTASHVAVVVTNLRVLGYSGETGVWDESRLEVGERVISLEADGKVASVLTNVRALGFGSRRGTWEVVRFPLR